MDYIYGKLNEKVKKVTYDGVVTSTAKTTTTTSLDENTIKVDVLKTPGTLTIVDNDGNKLSFNGSDNVQINLQKDDESVSYIEKTATYVNPESSTVMTFTEEITDAEYELLCNNKAIIKVNFNEDITHHSTNVFYFLPEYFVISEIEAAESQLFLSCIYGHNNQHYRIGITKYTNGSFETYLGTELYADAVYQSSPTSNKLVITNGQYKEYTDSTSLVSSEIDINDLATKNYVDEAIANAGGVTIYAPIRKG